MRIVYAVAGLWAHHPGLQSKVLGATRIWSRDGHEVYVVLHSQGTLLDANGEVISQSGATEFKGHQIAYYDRSRNKLARLLSLRHQYRFLRQTLRSIRPDVVYTRYALPFPGLDRSFSVTCPFVVEINSDDSVEYGIKSGLVGWANSLFRKSFLSHAAGLCFVSRELSLLPAFAWYVDRKAVISNSIECAKYPFTEDTGNAAANLCFIGSPRQSWHGLDKVVSLARHFPDWRFHIVGPDAGEVNVAGGAELPNLTSHGYLDGDAARELLSKIDVGISTLALHRKSMQEASPLKSRQYLAQGIPFISAYADTDIDDEEFVLRLENTEDNIAPAVEVIGQFVRRVFRNTSIRRQARQFAERNLDVSTKEKQRLEFINSVAER